MQEVPDTNSLPSTDSDRFYPSNQYAEVAEPRAARRRNQPGSRQRRRLARQTMHSMTQAHELEMAFARTPGMCFLASEAGDPVERLAVDLQNEMDVDECWLWLKKRGFGQVHGHGGRCKVEQFVQKPWTEALQSGLRDRAARMKLSSQGGATRVVESQAGQGLIYRRFSKGILKGKTSIGYLAPCGVSVSLWTNAHR
eukprot:Skav227127  [mRNA]  locus=scaffold133:96710:99074:- [translate_table: standard]